MTSVDKKKHPELASTRFQIHSGFKRCGFVHQIHRIRVDGSRIQKEKVADSIISGRAPANGAYEFVVAFVL